MCPVHSEDDIIVHPVTGRATCGRCSRIRERVALIAYRNQRDRSANGTGAQARRHPREVLCKVPNALLRERYEGLVAKGTTTATEIAIAAGYVMKRDNGRGGGTQGDIQRLKKQLGLATQYGKKDPVTGERPAYVAETVSYDAAVALCRAMGIEYPAEVGV